MESEPIDPKSYKNTGITRVFKAFCYSLEGICATLKHEAAFRQEAIFACILVPASCFLNVPLVQHLILVSSIFLVLMMELINSAIEAVVDDISLKNRPLAKRAKDIGSAAVFISLLNCFICWVSVLVVNWGSWFG
ncbi:MAG: diacylglycerol kinase [Opitutaceae bacterium]